MQALSRFHRKSTRRLERAFEKFAIWINLTSSEMAQKFKEKNISFISPGIERECKMKRFTREFAMLLDEVGDRPDKPWKLLRRPTHSHRSRGSDDVQSL